jgi:2-polyprenyl-3-methyl-5-hydroxy-6-metoxy-1,4-benzoquinol methylase
MAEATSSANHFHGTAFLYRLTRNPERATRLKLTRGDSIIFEVLDDFQISEPHYGHLLDESQVLHRQDIYGFGPPSREVLHEVICLCQTLAAPILDFGCGSGALVKALRARGIEAYGIELDREAINKSLSPEVTDFITHYDGTFPMPFRDRQFESVTAIEVLEHVPDFEAALSELARVARHNFIVTVPDMSAIPVCHHNHVVPWHLLEATHVNFFTQASLERILKRYFNKVEIARISPTTTNGSKWFDSLVGICHR